MCTVFIKYVSRGSINNDKVFNKLLFLFTVIFFLTLLTGNDTIKH